MAAIIDQQTGCQAALARTQGNQEAAVKRLSRLLHNERLKPKDFAEWLCRRALRQVPRTGRVRFTIDWTSEDPRYGGWGTPPVETADNWHIQGEAAVVLRSKRLE